jgi:hypothetical protein
LPRTVPGRAILGIRGHSRARWRSRALNRLLHLPSTTWASLGKRRRLPPVPLPCSLPPSGRRIVARYLRVLYSCCG